MGLRWKQYSGMWTRQQQMQAVSASTWPGVLVGQSLFSWGFNSQGQLGLNDTANTSSPVQVGSQTTWLTLGCGRYQAHAIKSDGTLWSWGQGDSGELGTNTIVNRSSPVQVGALTTWLAATGGAYFSVFKKTDGTLWSVGQNASGRLGQNVAESVRRSSPVQIGAGTDWGQYACGSNFVLAVKTNNSLWAWGSGYFGQLGQNNVIYRSSPVQIGSQTNWSYVSCGSQHSLAIKTNGTLWGWGINSNGMVGDNSVVFRSSPVQVGALTTWSLVAGSRYSSFAVKTDGTLWAWGDNSFGQLGQNNRISRSSPTQIGLLDTWSFAVTGTAYRLLAKKSDGTLWTCGHNTQGSLGVGDVVNRSSPVQIGSLTTWSSVASGLYNVIATQNIYSS